ncbi:MAG TPA: GNAT family N-acetyltransferase [Herpetosiphonaceae bacterium]|nr:GNAT family N-acetyltransferase [Herpetosiphonaceae bacterium]
MLQTRRLSLRRLDVDDAPFIFELLNDPDFIRFIGDKGINTLDDARNYILNGPLASYERFGFGMYLVMLDSGAPIGMCGLVKREALPDVDVGFALLPDFRGQGYAAEAAAAVVEHGRREFGLRRIAGIVDPANGGSIRVLEKLGLVFERMILMPGDDDEIKLFGRDL